VNHPNENDEFGSVPQSIEDFTEEAYRSLLRLAKSRYEFVSIDQFSTRDNVIFLRHDVDLSPHRAHALSKIESEENVRSTYFILLSSNFYNAFEQQVAKVLGDIAEMGHWIGLHFDCNRYSISDEQKLIRWIDFERSVLSRLLDIEVKAISFHNPTTVAKEFDKDQYAGLVNAYGKNLMDGAKYVSDSNGYWRFEHLKEVLESGRYGKLQILTHPEWWQASPMKPEARVRRCIDGRGERTYRDYVSVLRASGRVNVT